MTARCGAPTANALGEYMQARINGWDIPKGAAEGTSLADYFIGSYGDTYGFTHEANGNAGDDVYVGGDGVDIFSGGAGDDRFDAGGGNEQLRWWFGRRLV